MKLISFLGNKGKKYEKTRHNLAWIVAEEVNNLNSAVWNSKFNADFTSLKKNGTIYLLKPMTLMNRSGQSIAAALNFYKLKPTDLIVVHDDLELPFGTVQLRKGRGTAGHNGLKSIVSQIGSSDFIRFRLGISRPPSGWNVSDFVLSRFSPEEEAELGDYAAAAAAVIDRLIDGDSVDECKIKLI